MHPRTRRDLESLSAEKRRAAEAAIARAAARRATPEGRVEEAEVIRKVREEFPPLESIVPEMARAMAALRAERERQGLSLADVAERSGLDRSVVSKLENGHVANPTMTTLRRYASALGKRLELAVVEE